MKRGRRKGDVAYRGKSIAISNRIQPALYKQLRQAERRSKHSVADIMHLCFFEGVKLADVTGDSFIALQDK